MIIVAAPVTTTGVMIVFLPVRTVPVMTGITIAITIQAGAKTQPQGDEQASY